MYLTANALTTPIAQYRYTLLPTGHRQSVAELSGRTVTYGYDNLYRLTSETIAGAAVSGTITYTLDPVGNRLARNSSLLPLPSQLFTYDGNDRLGSDTYDANGNTTAADGTTYAYDFENRIISATSSGKVVQVVYDGDGNRVRKIVNGLSLFYLVDDNNLTGYAQVVEELGSDISGLVVNTVYTYGHDLISQERLDIGSGTWTAHYYGYDGHGNVRFLTDASGAITDTYDYDAFGNLIYQQVYNPGSMALEQVNPINDSLITINDFLYTGEQFDPDLGMYFLRARYMDTERGRFWTMDTFEGVNTVPMSLNKYLYAGADPVNGIDLSGHLTLTEILSAAKNIGIKARMAVVNVVRFASIKFRTTLLNIGVQVYVRAGMIGSGFEPTRRLIQRTYPGGFQAATKAFNSFAKISRSKPGLSQDGAAQFFRIKDITVSLRYVLKDGAYTVEIRNLIKDIPIKLRFLVE